MPTILVVGATGMTGMSLVEQLLEKNHKVRVIVRAPQKFSPKVQKHKNLTVIEAIILDLTDEEMALHVKDCDAVVSCLGHVLNFKGMFGAPRQLCTQAVQRLCKAIEKNTPTQPIKFILMNTVGVPNPDCLEKRTSFDRVFLTLLRYALPPQRDNETAAVHLHDKIAISNAYIEWCSVRPDTLINAEISEYEIAHSPTTGIFSGRPATRANVANFMVKLIEDTKVWTDWKFKMPVIMNVKN